MSNQRKLYINGKFLGSPLTAVHRVAFELVREIDLLAAQDSYFGPGIEILSPQSGDGASTFKSLAARTGGVLRKQLWEQFDLPRLGRDGVILSLCNLAPVLARQAITLIHDAQVFSTPESYPKGFAMWYRNVHRANGRRHTIATVSHFSASELARYGIGGADRIHVVHNGVDHILRANPDRGILTRHELKPLRYVVGLANLQTHKNIATLVRAFAQDALRGASDLRLVLVGGASRDAFRAAGVDLPDNVILPGTVSDEELRALLGQALCVASPSLTEGFGLLPLEGMLLGAPAVIAPSGAQPEVCGAAALHASPTDAGDWARQIMLMVQRPDERENRSVAGQAHARHFTWKRSAQMLMELACEEVRRLPRAAVGPASSVMHFKAAPHEER